MSRYDWMDEALCAQTDPAVFHLETTGGGSYETAARICAACPVRTQCRDHADHLEGATNRNLRHGLWGGDGPHTRAARAAGPTSREERDALILRLHRRGHMTTEAIARAADCDPRTVHRVTRTERETA